MGRKSTVLALPKEVLEGLKSNYLNNPTWTVDDHRLWLVEHGFNGSRTAVWRYLKEIDKIEATGITKSLEFSKLFCLDIASKYTDNKNELLTL